MLKLLYRIYQLLVCVPVMIVWTIFISLTTTIGCLLGGGHFWGYAPGKWWSWFTVKLFLLPVKVEGREHLQKGQSYVFVANHQGAFDIFLVYGYLWRNFKWMMKWQIQKIPFVGFACKMSHQIMVDKRSNSKIRATYQQAQSILKGGTSLMVFPEGARSFTGHMAKFKRGAFMLADELQLPVVPLTINGSFNVLPRTCDWHFVNWHPLRLTIHEPLHPESQGADNVKRMMNESYSIIMKALVPEYQGYVENPDQ